MDAPHVVKVNAITVPAESGDELWSLVVAGGSKQQ